MIYRFILLLFLSTPIFAQTIQEKLEFTAKAIKENNYKNIVVYQDDVLEHYKKNNKDLYLDYLVKFSGANFSLGNYKISLLINKEISKSQKKTHGKNHPYYFETLISIAWDYYKLRDYNKALKYFTQVFELRKKVLGEEHPTTFNTLTKISGLYILLKENEKALDLNLLCYYFKDKIKAKNHPDYLASLTTIATNFSSLMDFHKSLQINLELLTIQKNIYGKNHLDVLKTLRHIASNYNNLSEIDKSIEISLEIIPLMENLLGKENRDYLLALDNLSQTYLSVGEYKKAIDIDLQALSIKEKMLGAKHPEIVFSLLNLSTNYQNLELYHEALINNLKALEILEKNNKKDEDYLLLLMGITANYTALYDYNKALEYNLKAVQLIKNEFNTDLKYYLPIIKILVVNYKNTNNLDKSLEVILEVIKLEKRVYGTDHPEYLNSLSLLATIYSELGNYQKSLEINLQNIEIRKKKLGVNHPDYLTSLSNLALDYSDLGDFNKSLKITLNVLNSREKILGKEHPDYLTSLHNLASVYRNLGMYNKAFDIIIEVLNLKEKILGKEHPDYLTSLSTLASLYNHLKNYKKALEIDLEVIKLKEKILGKNHPDYITSLNNLAISYSNNGEIYKSIELNLEVLNLTEKKIGKEHPDYHTSLINLANSYNDLGNYNKALELQIKALKLQEKLSVENSVYLTLLNNLGLTYYNLENFKKSKEYYSKCLMLKNQIVGNNHPNYISTSDNLLRVIIKSQNYNESDSIYTHLITQKTSTIHEKLIGLDYNLKEIVKNNAIDDYLRFTNYALLRQKENPDLLNQSFNTWLNLNGLLSNQSEKLRTIVEQSGDKKLLEVYEDWIAQKMQLLKYYELTNDERNKRGIDIKKQQDNIAALEQQLSKKTDAFEEFKKQHSFADIQNKLKENEAYIDIVRLNYYDFNNDKWEDSVRYLVYVITKETKNKPMYIVLNNGKDLETDLITHYLSNNSLANKNNQEKDGVVYNNFWQPIADAIQNKKTIYTFLGGVYNNINLGTIYNPNTGKYLSEELDIRIINSGKSFVQNQNKSTLKNTKQTATLLGNPNFNANLKQKPTNYLYAISRDFTPYLSDEFKDTLSRSVATNALPGTKTEVENIGKLMRENKWETFVLLDTLATKTQLKNVNNPRVLHLATHGYFVNNTKLKKADGLQYLGMEKKVVADNPLLRSGLLLAGANKTLQGDSTPTNDNGIFTAYEASFLNLNQTELVVLSACETGKGDIKTGEGVYGLRKSFADAGAKNIIISLWAVDDDVTQQFMTNFYSLWLNGLSIKDAFTQTQNQIKQKYPLPYYWGGFILIENN